MTTIKQLLESKLNSYDRGCPKSYWHWNVHGESLELRAGKSLSSPSPNYDNSSNGSFIPCSTLPVSGICCSLWYCPLHSYSSITKFSPKVSTNLSPYNSHPLILILSLETTQKKYNPSFIFHMSALPSNI